MSGWTGLAQRLLRSTDAAMAPYRSPQLLADIDLLDLLELALVYVRALGDRASTEGHGAEGAGSDRTS